ncbi:PACE efflux transporter [Methylobacterium brachythecii]|uniref:Membrane protein n=1 Tax=Methylobacterium brachythecii TaxID=1176177 RepID=A0A7W6AML0_9HYPH|nr:PACE efflux transporter [Methylobacterium brachythecii]MBB3903989.1 putative membrane protein [Methylobacterium brachythecii]GLS42731.1 membrane protein [Methylobacterium brachythecii]
MRTIRDRVRHALMFEIVGLAIFTPGSAILLGQPVEHMGVIGIVSATTATLWNFIYNMIFDRILLRWKGTVEKNIMTRLVHTGLFEAGLVTLLIPFIAWYLGISLQEAIVIDLGIVIFYLFYAFSFNFLYDWVFPIALQAKPRMA